MTNQTRIVELWCPAICINEISTPLVRLKQEVRKVVAKWNTLSRQYGALSTEALGCAKGSMQGVSTIRTTHSRDATGRICGIPQTLKVEELLDVDPSMA